MSIKIAITREEKNVLTETNPNNFIFNSDFNSLKIIGQGIYTVNISASSTETFYLAHGQPKTPLCHAFAFYGNTVILPNEIYFSPLGSDIWVFKFNSLKSDKTNIVFTVSNGSGSQITVSFKYFIFEVPL